MAERHDIKVSVSILADISLGIYRTPANALKELITNAFDADATQVVISTGYPDFRVMVCSDDGYGMDSQDFVKIMNRIGGSSKRDESEYSPTGRPLIGKIGIGILAVAQICRRFTVISSKRGSNTKFEAVVDFEGFASKAARKVPIGSEEGKKIGSYTLVDDLPEASRAHYTKVVLEEIDEGFRKRLSEAPELSIDQFSFKASDPENFDQFLNLMAGTGVRKVSDYNKLIWELGVICPVGYLPDAPIRGHKVIGVVVKALRGYHFDVVIDGLPLYKPIRFPTSPGITEDGVDYRVYDIKYDQIVNGKRLAFVGYLFHQREAIVPAELRGVLIRVRNVGIGMYDKSLLNYPKVQGPRMMGLSGEIYILEGLEDALNIDRNSFRETDPHYLKLQEVLYTRLGGDQETKTPGIFSDISKRSQVWNARRRTSKTTEARKDLAQALLRQFGENFSIVPSDRDSDVPVKVDLEQKRIVIFETHRVFPRHKAAREFAEKFLVAYELANAIGGSNQEMREKFYRLLLGE